MALWPVLLCRLTAQNATAQAGVLGWKEANMFTIHKYFESEEELQAFLKTFDTVPDKEKPKIFIVDDDTGEVSRVM